MDVIDKKLFVDSFQYFDKEIIAEIIDIFLDDYSERLTTIKNSIDTLNFEELKFHAHSLKGVVANFAAPSVQEIAKSLETKGVNSENINLLEDFEILNTLTNQLAEELKAMKADYS